MKDKLFPIVLSIILAGCGGGGGGGGKSGDKSPAPANLNPGGGSLPADMQSGIFSDGPVSGLRFVQGQHVGLTDDEGRFTYNANSAAPVQFFIGEIYLGSAQGADVVTPFNLSINNTPVTLDAGINISRTLMSLDTDSNPYNGIALPGSTSDAGGQIEFGLTTAQFEVDPQVAYLLQRHAEGRDLVSVQEARQHLDQNPVATARITAIEQAIDAAISRVDVSWDNTRMGAGILAHYRASNGEQLVVELGEQEDNVWLKRAIYANAHGVVRIVEFDPHGGVTYVDNNGVVSQYLKIADFDAIRFVGNKDVYQPVSTAYLAGASGLQNADRIHPLHSARINDIAVILQRQLSSTATVQDRIQMASHLMSLLSSISCAGAANCGFVSALSGALDLALADAEYRESRFITRLEELDAQICLNAPLGAPNDQCASNRLLTNILMSSGNRVEAFVVGLSEYNQAFDDNAIIKVETAHYLEVRNAMLEGRNFGPYGRFFYNYRTQPKVTRLNQNEVLLTVNRVELVEAGYWECEVAYVEDRDSFQEVCRYLQDSAGRRLFLPHALAVFENFFLGHAWVMAQDTDHDRRYCVMSPILQDVVYNASDASICVGYMHLIPVNEGKTEALAAAAQHSVGDIRQVRFNGQVFRNSSGWWSADLYFEFEYSDSQLGRVYVTSEM